MKRVNSCLSVMFIIIMLNSFKIESATAKETGWHSSDEADMIEEDLAADQDTNTGPGPDAQVVSMEAAAQDKNDITISTRLLDALVGRHGGASNQNGGVVYTRWGRTTCPTDETELLYTGYAGGSPYNHHGGGSNYLCLPQQPEYLKAGCPANTYFSYLYGSEYQYPLIATRDYNVPCSVCYAPSRNVQLMIPAKTTCPGSWTEEYQGYLMAERWNHPRSVAYVCVDENAESLAGTGANTDGSLFYHVVAVCGKGLPCPPYVKTKTTTCVVCTK